MDRIECRRCHDADVQKGDFRIDNLSAKIGFEEMPQLLERINSGEMPPKKEKVKPTVEERAKTPITSSAFAGLVLRRV